MHQLISRKEAIDKGLHMYFTGKPCKNGHISPRYTSVRTCVECLSIQTKAWRKNNPDKHKVNQVRWNTKNKAYYATKHRERDLHMSLYLTNLLDTERTALYSVYNTYYKLGLCWHVDHIIPLSKGGRHHPDNLMIVSAPYNISKGSKVYGNPFLWLCSNCANLSAHPVD